MTPAKWVNVALIWTYLILAAMYATEKAWPKVLYWTGAAILGTGVLLA